MAHSTARDSSASRGKGSKQLVLESLDILARNDRKRVSDHPHVAKQTAIIATDQAMNYACSILPRHLSLLSWTHTDVLTALWRFLDSQAVLNWIAHLAEHSQFHHLIETGRALGSFIRGYPKRSKDSSGNFEALKDWSFDLVRLFVDFRSELDRAPSSIFYLNAPVCKQITAAQKRFGYSSKSHLMVGLRPVAWNDCIFTVTYPEIQLSCLATSRNYWAIGSRNGRIHLLKQDTYENLTEFRFRDQLRMVLISSDEKTLVGVGLKGIIGWSLPTKTRLYYTETPRPALSVAFCEHDQFLVAVTEANQLSFWNSQTGEPPENTHWSRNPMFELTHLYYKPITAAFNSDSSLAAIMYENENVVVWKLTEHYVFRIIEKQSAPVGEAQRRSTGSDDRRLMFGSGSASNLLICSYIGSVSVVSDVSTCEVVKKLTVPAQTLAFSPDGSILASTDLSETITLYSFENMHPIFRIRNHEPNFLSMAFSSDGLRLVDVRSSSCRIWGPFPLNSIEPATIEDSISSYFSRNDSDMVDNSLENRILVTAIAYHPSGDILFCGKEDGSIYICDTKTGIFGPILYSHDPGKAVTLLQFDESSNLITSVDTSNKILRYALDPWPAPPVVGVPLFYYCCRSRVTQIVCQKKSTKILICSLTHDTLYMSTIHTGPHYISGNSHPIELREWANHPLSDSQLILVTKGRVGIYSWATLRRSTKPEGILLQGIDLAELSISSITSCFGGKVLMTTFSGRLRVRSHNKHFMWDAEQLVSGGETIRPLHVYEAFASNVELPIGTIPASSGQAERFVFLADNNWICSADAKAARKGDFTKHFLFPADWLSRMPKPMLQVTSNGDIALVKEDDIAIVQQAIQGVQMVDDLTT